jgi:hypothetical protein
MKYFRIFDRVDGKARDRYWMLSDPTSSQGEPWEPFLHLVAGEKIQVPPYEFAYKLLSDGSPLRFNLSGLYIPVVDVSLADRMCDYCGDELQILGARIGSDLSDKYRTLNIASRVDCLNAAKSDYIPWPDDYSGDRSRAVGWILKRPVLKRGAIEGRHAFRIAHWGNDWVVDETLITEIASAVPKGIYRVDEVEISD